jgi:hypothetical protein
VKKVDFSKFSTCLPEKNVASPIVLESEARLMGYKWKEFHSCKWAPSHCDIPWPRRFHVCIFDARPSFSHSLSQVRGVERHQLSNLVFTASP